MFRKKSAPLQSPPRSTNLPASPGVPSSIGQLAAVRRIQGHAIDPSAFDNGKDLQPLEIKGIHAQMDALLQDRGDHTSHRDLGNNDWGTITTDITG